MGTFSTGMRNTATKLITKLGNPCTLTKVTKGVYSPSVGQSEDAKQNFSTYSAPVKQMTDNFALMGLNTNLQGFDDNKVIVPWIGQEIDAKWLYNGNNILTVSPIETQGDIVIYTITIGEK